MKGLFWSEREREGVRDLVRLVRNCGELEASDDEGNSSLAFLLTLVLRKRSDICK